MSNPIAPDDDDLLPEYDPSVFKDGARGKYFERYRAGTNLALLAPDVRAAFPTDEAVNRAPVPHAGSSARLPDVVTAPARRDGSETTAASRLSQVALGGPVRRTLGLREFVMPDMSWDYPKDLVPHPRFGDRSVPSGFDVPHDVIKTCYCYARPPVFPASAIPADVSRQKYSVRPRRCYVDMLKGCRKCGRDFLFFAREQQFWYEELGFWVDAECIHCPECRRSNHHLRQRFHRFSRFIRRNETSAEELAILVEDAVFLFESGVLRNEQKLRRLKNLARARIPESQASRAIEGLIAGIEERKGHLTQ